MSTTSSLTLEVERMRRAQAGAKSEQQQWYIELQIACMEYHAEGDVIDFDDMEEPEVWLADHPEWRKEHPAPGEVAKPADDKRTEKLAGNPYHAPAGTEEGGQFTSKDAPHSGLRHAQDEDGNEYPVDGNEWELPDGMLNIKDPYNLMSEKGAEEIAQTFLALREIAPLKPHMRLDVIVHDIDDMPDEFVEAAGWANPSEPNVINLIPDNIIMGGTDASGHLMPVSRMLSDLTYTVAHEYGHLHDFQHHSRNKATSGRSVWLHNATVMPEGRNPASPAVRLLLKSNMSAYGQTNQYEGYAEAFTEWHMNRSTNNAAAHLYAATFGWIGGDQTPHRHALPLKEGN